MRKSGPFRSITLCAYTAVGADPEVAGVVAARKDVPGEVAGVAGPAAGGGDLRCHNTTPNKQAGTAIRTTRRARIRIYSMGRWFREEWPTTSGFTVPP